MSWTGLVNAVALTVALGLGVVSAGTSVLVEGSDEASAESDPALTEIEGESGTRVRVDRYVRIVSTSTIADQVLPRLIEPDRVLTVSAQTLRTSREPWRYDGKVVVERLDELERIIGLAPDLVLVGNLADPRHAARLDEVGITVFDLGRTKGLQTLLADIEQLAALLGVPERGERLASQFERRFRRVAAGLLSDPQQALYLGIHGDRLYGGARGSSYHDVLTAAGLVDAASVAGFDGWPHYTSEDILGVGPRWIVTQAGSEGTLCRHPGFERLEACTEQRVVGIDPELLVDPGFGMLEAAEAIHDAVYSGSDSQDPPSPRTPEENP